jgi:hypothetical protein
MLLSILQMGLGWIGEYEEIILSGVLIVVDIFLLKLGLFLMKSEYRTKIKWVGISFLIQFGAIFFISSPMLILGFTGAFSDGSSTSGGGGPPAGLIVLAIVGSTFLDFNLINVIHKIGLKKSLLVTVIILVPIIFAMSFLIQFLSKLPYIT